MRIKVSPVEQFLSCLVQLGIPAPENEYQFAAPRRWRFDFAWPGAKIAVEVEGGIFIRGRHVRPLGYINDIEKYNRAAILGWQVLRWAPQLNPSAHEELMGFLTQKLKQNGQGEQNNGT